jgi:hypothetical protein
MEAIVAHSNGLINRLSKRLKEGMREFKKNPLPLLLMVLAYGVIELFFFESSLKDLMESAGSTGSVVVALLKSPLIIIKFTIYEVVRVVFLIGFISTMLLMVEGKRVGLMNFPKFITKKRFLRIVMLECVIVPIMFAGGMLLILPGLVWIALTVFSYFIILKKENTQILDSVTQSIAMTKGVRTELFTLCIAYSIFGLVALVLPVFYLVMDMFLTPLLGLVLTNMFKEKSGA